MKKFLITCILATGCAQQLHAQTDSVPEKKEKIFEHSVGVQINTLIREVLNFSNAPVGSVNNNLLIYSINLKKTGWGARAAVGYTYNSNATDDGITKTVTDINSLHFRFGIEKAFWLSQKWSAGVGIDGIMNSNDDKTTTTVRSFDTTTTATKTVLSSYGGGVMGWVRYHLSSHLSIGTESSFYYTTGTNDQTIDITTKTSSGLGGVPTTKTTETHLAPTVKQGNFTMPVAFYLIVRF